MRMISWNGRPHLNGPSVVDFRGKRPVIVTEQQADPVALAYAVFQRLDAAQQHRLLLRIAKD
jgi:hypothetical protein